MQFMYVFMEKSRFLGEDLAKLDTGKVFFALDFLGQRNPSYVLVIPLYLHYIFILSHCIPMFVG